MYRTYMFFFGRLIQRKEFCMLRSTRNIILHELTQISLSLKVNSQFLARSHSSETYFSRTETSGSIGSSNHLETSSSLHVCLLYISSVLGVWYRDSLYAQLKHVMDPKPMDSVWFSGCKFAFWLSPKVFFIGKRKRVTD